MYGSNSNGPGKETKLADRSKRVGCARPDKNDELDIAMPNDAPQSKPRMTEQEVILGDYFSSLLGQAEKDTTSTGVDRAEQLTDDDREERIQEHSAGDDSVVLLNRECPCFDTAIATNRLLSVPLRPETIPFIPTYMTAVRALQCLFELLGFLRTELPQLVRRSFLERCDEMIMLFRFSRHYPTMSISHER